MKILFILPLLLIFLASCGDGLDEGLVGTWAWAGHAPINLVFGADGRGERNWHVEQFEGYRWTAGGSRLSIRRDSAPRGETTLERWTYTLSDDGNTLVIQSQNRQELHRVYTYHRVVFDDGLVGRWIMWELPAVFIAFDAAGVGVRNWLEVTTQEDGFGWQSSGGVHLAIIDDDGFEHWEYRLEGTDTLYLFGEGEGVEFEWIFHRAMHDPRLVGEWAFVEMPAFRMVFYENGGGRRNWHSADDDFAPFSWYSAGEDSLAIAPSLTAPDIESWVFELSDDGNILTILSLEAELVYVYERVR